MLVKITVTNDAPVVNNSLLATEVGKYISGTLSGSDPEGDSLVYSIDSPPTHGAVLITNTLTGLYRYTPDDNYSGSDSFTFKASDSLDNSISAMVSILISGSPVLLDKSPARFNSDAVSLPITDVINSSYSSDVDGDGDMDLLYASDFDDKISWHESNGDGSFTEHIVETNVFGSKSVQASDLDGDGDIDLFSAFYSANGGLRWYENDGYEKFTTHAVDTEYYVNYITSNYVSDIDGDGDMDLLTSSHDVASSGGSLSWHENDGNENFTSSHYVASSISPSSVFASDVDSDGDIDLLLASLFPASESIFLDKTSIYY